MPVTIDKSDVKNKNKKENVKARFSSKEKTNRSEGWDWLEILLDCSVMSGRVIWYIISFIGHGILYILRGIGHFFHHLFDIFD